MRQTTVSSVTANISIIECYCYCSYDLIQASSVKVPAIQNRISMYYGM